MLDLDPKRIDLWFVFFNEIQDQERLNQYRYFLTEEERRREQRFYFSKDQRRYLITRALVRSVLSRYSPIEPNEWRFAACASGKPKISNSDYFAERISFNISHSESLIVLGVTFDNALGVDTESTRERQLPIEIIKHCLSYEEGVALNALPAKKQIERFLQHWTLKESYIKARGAGLLIPLNQCWFQFSKNEDCRIDVPDYLDVHSTTLKWRFWQFRASEDDLVAVCVKRTTSGYQRLMMKKIVPLDSEEILRYETLMELPSSYSCCI